MLTPEEQIVVALRRISQAIDVWSRHLFQVYGLTSPQLATLREIQAGQNVTTGTLATALHLSQPTVTGILGRLEQRGLITREKSEVDRRSSRATVTEEGKNLAAAAPPLLRDRFCQALGRLPQQEQSEVLKVLQHVAEMMQAPQLDEQPFLFYES
jgi:DNA-binding MarR family transcriptional regulator